MAVGSEAFEEAILVVDGDETSRNRIGEVLHRNGFTCDFAANVPEAMKRLAKGSYALVLSDIRMPGKSGLELAAHVKSAGRDTAFILVTEFTDMNTARQTLQRGIDGWIAKPIEGVQLLIGVANALRRRELALQDKAEKQNLEKKAIDRANKLRETTDLLRIREKELETKIRELGELDSALRVLLNKRENDRSSMEESVMANVRKLIAPSIQRMKTNSRQSEQIQKDLRIIEHGLNELVNPFVKHLTSDHFGLTPNEIQVATLIKQGMRTKEIASTLNLSANTIMTHRYKIRSKLGIKNKNQNLQVYLNNLQNQ